MNIETVRVKLHDYIEHADQSKIIAMYTLLSNDLDARPVYDEATLNLLEKTSDYAFMQRKNLHAGANHRTLRNR